MNCPQCSVNGSAFPPLTFETNALLLLFGLIGLFAYLRWEKK
jgi:hypothetical protein